MEEKTQEKTAAEKVIIDPKEMHRAKAQKLTIELQVQNDISRIKFHRMGRSAQWRDLTGCEQLEVIDALELAIREAKANAKIDVEMSNWKELNEIMLVRNGRAYMKK